MSSLKEEELTNILPEDGPTVEEVKKYLEKYNDEFIVIKCGGSVLVDPNLFKIFIEDVSVLKKLGFNPIVVHGGGKRINNKLSELEKFIFNEFNSDNSKGEFIDKHWLRKKIAKFFNRPVDETAIDEVFFIPFMETFIKNAPTRIIKGKNKAIAKGTITKYNTTQRKLEEYEKRFKTKLKFTDLDLTFYDRFVNFLSQEQKINLGTIGNYIGTLKTIARDAKLKGLPVHAHIEHPNFFVPKITADSIYLNDDEINKIFNHDFKGVERLENTRDLFIIGLRTGLRISDFLRLKDTNIKNGYIEIETQKTGQTVTIPLHKQVKEILEKRNGFPRAISDQKFNEHVKELCIVAGFKEWKSADDDLNAAKELAASDPDFASEIPALEESAQKAAEKLEELLLPRDPNDDRDVIIEVKAGAGGDESAIFAGDLLRMYMRYAEKRNWKVEILDATESEMGGYKDISVAVKSKGTAAPGESPYARLKFEGGVHRVQRVPETESQGRIHTSAAGVLILPEAEEVDVELNMNDVRVDVYRSSGPGGQSVNTTDSAVRLTHVPTGIVVSCQNEKSQLQNKESALRILRARLLADAQEKADALASAERKNQVRTVDRSERIRTYNYPENRLSDHRVNYKSNNLDSVLNGDLDDVIQSLLDADKAAKLASTE